MNYSKIYNNLINDAKINPKSDNYKELHHIIPLCIGGTNTKDNLIRLTARQHFIAHWLLYKIHRCEKTAFAWFSMCRIGKGQEERRINSKLFQYCKIEKSKLLSEKSKGTGNNFYGKKHTEKTKKIISEKNKKSWKPKTQEKLLDWINEVAKKPKSEEHKQKIGKASKGYYIFQNINTLEIIRIKKELINDLDLSVWVHPKKLNPEEKFKCNYCDIVTTKSNLSRWHNEKCRYKIRECR